ncbi:Zf-CCHC domain-containing protein [Abeliophyllum distichum]|uniref:Zf-CCHC domain-containing protein n=1 Tax=Abeliophyllum distichum TaxID=126358 RepID=A0ABD1PEQ1_9LAMI
MSKDETLSLCMCPKTPKEKEEMSNVPYSSAVGSLMYAMMCARPDICYVVGLVSRYQSNPGSGHWKTAKKILRYLKESMSNRLRLSHLHEQSPQKILGFAGMRRNDHVLYMIWSP